MPTTSQKLPELKEPNLKGFNTGDLNEREFMTAFNKIRAEQHRTRRRAKKTLTPAQLRDATPTQLAKLGKRADGLPFTKKDLEQFRKAAKNTESKRAVGGYGITYAEMVVGSTDIDIKRANNQVNDGSGITNAMLVGIRQGNVVAIRVKASNKSKHDDHRVMLRLESWDAQMMLAPQGKKGYQKATKEACKDRMAIQCSCGRFQFWYRYQATIGQYVLSPPKESAYPKLNNPSLQGVACKHILKAATKLQSATWQRRIAQEMERQATNIGFGGKGAFTVTAADKKALARAKKDQVHLDDAEAEYKRYKKRQERFKREGKLSSKKEIAALKRQRKQQNEREREQDKRDKEFLKQQKELERKEKALNAKIANVAKVMSDAEKVKRQTAADAEKLKSQTATGDNKKISDFAKMQAELMASGMSPEQIAIMNKYNGDK